MKSENISSHREEKAPDAAFSGNFLFARGLDDADNGAGDVFFGAKFLAADISVAHKGDFVAVKGEDAVEHIAAAAKVGKDDVPDFHIAVFAERNAVLFASKVRQHAATLCQDDDLLAFGEKICNLSEQYFVGNDSLFHYAVTVSWHRTAAASSGRQSSVKQGTERTIFSMVSCIPSAMEGMERKPEQEG